MTKDPNFDGIARFYRWLEYCSLGWVLEGVRKSFLAELPGCRQALVLGDGDGRFTAALLRENAVVRVEAVDLSGEMLRLLGRRCRFSGDRVRVCRANVVGYRAQARPDVVVTHFLLDCLEQAEVDGLVARLGAELPIGGLWVVSEFRIPEGVVRWPARVYVAGLYLAFRVLTGLQVRRLPEFAGAMAIAGLRRVEVRRTLFGILTAELWQKS